jgi:hypothetical protein
MAAQERLVRAWPFAYESLGKNGSSNACGLMVRLRCEGTLQTLKSLRRHFCK